MLLVTYLLMLMLFYGLTGGRLFVSILLTVFFHVIGFIALMIL